MYIIMLCDDKPLHRFRFTINFSTIIKAKDDDDAWVKFLDHYDELREYPMRIVDLDDTRTPEEKKRDDDEQRARYNAAAKHLKEENAKRRAEIASKGE